MQKRDFIFDTIKKVFKFYGYQPIETPAMENLTTLLGKYGDEGDRLIFRILNSGNFLSGTDDIDLNERDTGKLASLISEKGLRYDLTVPFARYVAQHRDEITFPFKRYQIQPVWRADRPQKGRYREFFQCDVDIIGSDSLLNEYELIKIIDDVFTGLGIKVLIRINNRKILLGIAEYIGESSRITDITVAIDKLDKIGRDAVNKELREKGISSGAIEKLNPLMKLKGDISKQLLKLEEILSGSATGTDGLNEMKALFSYIRDGNISASVDFDITLARGLDYYTGAIIEVKSADFEIGSICGGGRYDDLTGVFGLDGVSGVGVSFGADRIYDVMKQLDLFDSIVSSPVDVLLLNFGSKETEYSLGILQQIRELGIRAELYPDPVKLKRQMSYADSKNIPYIIIAGEEEIRANVIRLKVMSSGEQKDIPISELTAYIQSLLNTKP